jgi:hypothetical protein
MKGGKQAITQWSGVEPLRAKIRIFGRSDTQNMIARFREADEDLRESFYYHYRKYHLRVNVESPKYFSLQKELGIPAINVKDGRTASLNFYYAQALKMCYDHVNRLNMKEKTDVAVTDIYHEVITHNKNEPNPYEHYDDSYILSVYISKLGEHTRERIDHKKAGYRLRQQDKNVLEFIK